MQGAVILWNYPDNAKTAPKGRFSRKKDGGDIEILHRSEPSLTLAKSAVVRVAIKIPHLSPKVKYRFQMKDS